MESKTPALTSLSILDANITVDNLQDVEHIVNDKSISGKRAGMGIMIGGAIYLALGPKNADKWIQVNADADLLEVSKYFKYDAERDILVATRTIATEPSTVNVGNHAISSAGQNFVFTNLVTNIAWTPPWSGIKDHSLPENLYSTGIIPLTSRQYRH